MTFPEDVLDRILRNDHQFVDDFDEIDVEPDIGNVADWMDAAVVIHDHVEAMEARSVLGKRPQDLSHDWETFSRTILPKKNPLLFLRDARGDDGDVVEQQITVDIKLLNPEQRVAFDMVTQHFDQQKVGTPNAPLLLIIQGSAGTATA